MIRIWFIAPSDGWDGGIGMVACDDSIFLSGLPRPLSMQKPSIRKQGQLPVVPLDSLPILKEYGVGQLLLGGQISRSADLFIPAIRSHLPESVKVRTVSDIDNATFNGLKALL